MASTETLSFLKENTGATWVRRGIVRRIRHILLPKEADEFDDIQYHSHLTSIIQLLEKEHASVLLAGSECPESEDFLDCLTKINTLINTSQLLLDNRFPYPAVYFKKRTSKAVDSNTFAAKRMHISISS
jgi:hypothetical protein